MKNYNILQQRYMVNTYPNRQLVLVKGEGVYLYDEQGKKYLDMMSNYGVSILGYSNKNILATIVHQINRLPTLHGSFNNDVRAVASTQLVKRCGNDYYQVYWSNSGAEAIEAAIKFAVLTTGKYKLIACHHAYHGKTLGALAATDGDKYRQPFIPMLGQINRINYNNLAELEKAIDNETAAFIVEPVQGEGGIIPPDKDYLTKAKKICQQKNIILIFDEIQSGCGRTGYFLASQETNVTADIVCLGKGLAGGIPIGATVVTESIAKKIPKNIHTSTFGGNPAACAGVIAILNLLDEKMLSHVKKLGQYFIKVLKTIKSPLVKDVRGKGLMIGLVVVPSVRNSLLKKMQDAGILVIPAGDDVVRFLPPYIIEKEHVDFVINKLNLVLSS